MQCRTSLPDETWAHVDTQGTFGKQGFWRWMNSSGVLGAATITYCVFHVTESGALIDRPLPTKECSHWQLTDDACQRNALGG